MLIVDVETFRDYFLIGFKNTETGKYAAFEMFEGQPLKINRVRELMGSSTTVSFNGNGYDLFMIAYALQGATCEKLKSLSDAIIKSNLPPWRVARDRDVSIPRQWRHIDTIEVAPGKASLKIYGGRLHFKTMQDLPLKPDDSVAPEMRETIRLYNRNDLDTTQALLDVLMPAIELREQMGKQYGGIELRSKSDAQIAEAVIRHELVALTNEEYRPKRIEPGEIVRYEDPGIIEFRTLQLRQIFRRILDEGFPIATNGSVRMPDWLAKTQIKIGGGLYQMGIGGLHSCEHAQSIVAADDEMLLDVDVASYYPSIILKLKLAPESMGVDFTRVYQSLVTRRLYAKAMGDKVTADTLKITLNGSFGKLGSMYSIFYAPALMIQTTITGQLGLLMLIERLNAAGMRVVSANTDGVVILCKKRQQAELDAVTFEWMMDTSFELERSDYSALHSRDVNNYIAVKTDGGVKRKGIFAEPGLSKNPEFMIVGDALCALLSKRVPVEETISQCRDIRKFVAVRRVDGGAQWRDQYLGKAVRYYYSSESEAEECITYARNGNKVPKSDGARPLMVLPDAFPGDVDIDRYVDLAREALKDMGVEHA